jgi:hypothetical protein
MNIRKFNDSGVAEYKNWLIRMRDEGEQNLPDHLLEDDNYTIVLNEELEDRTFVNTREFGEYVNSVINENLIADFGMWNWLSCYYLKFLLPLNRGVRKKPGSLNRYVVTEGTIFTSDPFRRHLVAMPALFAKAHNGEGEILDIILSQTHLGTYGDMQEQPLATQEYYYCKPFLKTIYRLYWDTDRNTIKRGGSSNVRRLIEVIGSLSFTHDFNNMNVDDIVELLPREFDEWL